ncbi:hypothetical protein KKI17_03425 [Patescibacteria group bacterium]|nr:hypothetical protein [Patescibacteria group bacterium]
MENSNLPSTKEKQPIRVRVLVWKLLFYVYGSSILLVFGASILIAPLGLGEIFGVQLAAVVVAFVVPLFAMQKAIESVRREYIIQPSIILKASVWVGLPSPIFLGGGLIFASLVGFLSSPESVTFSFSFPQTIFLFAKWFGEAVFVGTVFAGTAYYWLQKGTTESTRFRAVEHVRDFLRIGGIILGVAALLFAFAAALLYQEYSRKGLIEQESRQAEPATSQWQTYKSEDYGFEIKYPKELAFKELGERGINFEFSNNGLKVFLQILSNQQLLNLHDYIVNEYGKNGALIYKDLTKNEGVEWVNEKRGTIDIWTYGFVPNLEGFEGDTFLQDTRKLNTVILLRVNTVEENSSENENIYTQMLSTFKFIETSAQELDNTIVKTEWGVSFTKSAEWEITSNTSEKIELKQVSGEWIGDRMDITFLTGISITTDDAKFGSITYYYDEDSQRWMKRGSALEYETGSDSSIPATPYAGYPSTEDGLPVFPGTTRWATFIIPLSHTTFLKLHITGSGSTQSLEDMLRTVRTLIEKPIEILSPQKGEAWKIGETNTIKLSKPVEESYPFQHLTLNGTDGKEIGIISCKIGATAALGPEYERTAFTWDTKTLFNYCGAGLEGKTKQIERGIYKVAVTKDIGGRPIIAESELFAIFEP